jgi:hypothetical protein
MAAGATHISKLRGGGGGVVGGLFVVIGRFLAGCLGGSFAMDTEGRKARGSE